MKKGTSPQQSLLCRSLQGFLAMTAIFFIFVSSTNAAELAPEGTRERKFQRGLLNTAFAPAELSKQLAEARHQDKWLATWIPAGFWGSVHTVVRAVTGIYEIITFPIPSPPNYRPILKPEFALQRLD